MGTNIFFKKKNIKISKIFPNHNFKDDFKVNSVKPLVHAQKNDITFFDSIKYKNDINSTKAEICIVSNKLEKLLPKNFYKIIVQNVLFELARVAKLLYPLADIDYPDLSLKTPNKLRYKKVRFGNNVLVGKKVKIGKYSIIGSNSIIENNVIIGQNCVIGSGVIIKNSILGNHVVIQDNCKIGQKGFGFIPINGKNTYLDNQVHIAHNVQIGANCMIAGQVGFAGSSKIGDNVSIGGQAGVSGHLKIGKNVKIGGGSGVVKDINDNEIVMGYPAVPLKDFLKKQKK